MEQRRIIVTMGSSESGEGFFVPDTRRGEQLELAENLAGAMRACIERPCERLYVSILEADPHELTSLSLFRSICPSQYIVAVVDESIRDMVESLGLANEYVTLPG